MSSSSFDKLPRNEAGVRPRRNGVRSAAVSLLGGLGSLSGVRVGSAAQGNRADHGDNDDRNDRDRNRSSRDDQDDDKGRRKQSSGNDEKNDHDSGAASRPRDRAGDNPDRGDRERSAQQDDTSGTDSNPQDIVSQFFGRQNTRALEVGTRTTARQDAGAADTDTETPRVVTAGGGEVSASVDSSTGTVIAESHGSRAVVSPEGVSATSGGSTASVDRDGPGFVS